MTTKKTKQDGGVVVSVGVHRSIKSEYNMETPLRAIGGFHSHVVTYKKMGTFGDGIANFPTLLLTRIVAILPQRSYRRLVFTITMATILLH
jgi:hypothetical protein